MVGGGERGLGIETLFRGWSLTRVRGVGVPALGEATNSRCVVYHYFEQCALIATYM